MSILTIASSPSASSRSARLLGRARESLAAHGIVGGHLDLRDLSAEALVRANVNEPSIAAAVKAVAEADAIIIATPVYKAAYSGLLKIFLDLLPQDALSGKLVLPIASGGSLAHALAIDYALRPVLSSLNAHNVLPGIFAVDKEIEVQGDGSLLLSPALLSRLTLRLADLRAQLPHAAELQQFARLPQAQAA
ncbi:NADPH-dependent FMN reductase [Uliginosibacterium sp. H3]|uniref:NADPH-dependent FMN reductase n=1 Tax=Uliginosibacterium silvisoli TaxID=3114758 RepID=A0ABU6K027_9RHOO|nr:NADPH-dependent FMN reductase [Uliginosibacterium sp. H3]